MPGAGTSKTEQSQSSQTQPWAPAQPMLQNLLGGLSNQFGNYQPTQNENSALNQITANAQNMKQQAPLFKAMAKAMDETAGEVKDGKYQNVNQAHAALQQKIAAAVLDSRGGPPSGSYRGRGSNGSGGSGGAGGRGPNQ